MHIHMLIHTYIHVHTDRPSSCTYLDTRLTFRSADSTGILEVCNEQGQWSVVCADSSIASGDSRVACNQLGFDPNLSPNVNRVPINPAVSDANQPFSFIFRGNGLSCFGMEQNLTSCAGATVPTTQPPPLPIRRKRVVVEPLACGTVARIGCAGKNTLLFK